jgi:hypothetical protein
MHLRYSCGKYLEILQQADKLNGKSSMLLGPHNPVVILRREEPHTTTAGSTRRKHLAVAKPQRDKEPQEGIDISATRDIDLLQGGEYVLL